MTVVTSHRLLWDLAADGAVLLPLGPLTPQTAIELLAHFAGEGRMSAYPEAAALSLPKGVRTCPCRWSWPAPA
ncbi:hypothetical protein [Streptomyces sp. NPDC102476]|uniref:hypothetical protein n=1 Tax=Streptomyces sp. NPDC102476 TaxID=3366181 RepID=UPI003812E12A